MIRYRIVIVPSKKGTSTSANVWIVLSGTLSETSHIPVPKSTLNFEYKVNALLQQFLRIDNLIFVGYFSIVTWAY